MINNVLPLPGVPVLFINGPTLPGGGGGRTSGLLELFNVATVNTATKKLEFQNGHFDWRDPPRNPNPELAGRLRASFWNTIRKKVALSDAAYKVKHLRLYK